MNHINVFRKDENEIETLTQTRIYYNDIGMEFGIEIFAMLIMKCEKREIIEVIELKNQESIQRLEDKENFHYRRIESSHY